jgi:hypothetical protein
MLDQNRPYCRVEIDRVFNRVKAAMHVTALVSGKSKGLTQAHYYDAYTAKELIGGDAYEYAHIRSLEEIHTRYKSIITDEEIALVVTVLKMWLLLLPQLIKLKERKKWKIGYVTMTILLLTA